MASLWDWTLEAYGRPGVPEACLALQDHHGQNVCLLLWAAWGGVSDVEVVGAAAAMARDWEIRVLAPLRAARRGLKAPAPPVADVARESLRQDVKTAELRAEQVLMETLEGMGRAADRGRRLESLQAAAGAWGKPAPPQALAALVAALG